MKTAHNDFCGAHISPKARFVALLLCWFLGWLGAHRFYVGKVGTAILMILTLGGLGVWSFIDLILILVGSFRDKQGRAVFYWFERHSFC
ncbi:TM2 domain-containing protein [Estrella lausannensis]|uniref:TM2 domain-containing protein n=1 Tax=Estrella lausannensis TaxID=483423 RepID=UPI001EF69437|nr:TM2 domain-containing protein [Estrella lausannensis]